MKKLLVICLTVITVMSMSLSVFAAPGKFIQSPTANPDPVIIEITPLSQDCAGELIITSYSKRHTLPDDERAQIEAAYSEIVKAIDLTKFCDIFAAHASKEKIDAEDLAVSDLFDIRVVNCTHHEPHDGFIITIRLDGLENFAGLLHRHNDDWEMVEGATVSDDGTTLTFQVDELSPFAVVVDTSDNPPFTGDTRNVAIYGAVALLSAAALVVVFVKLKKSTTDAE